MASVSKEIAEKEVEKLKKQKRPKMYCVVRYQNRLSGDSEKGTYSGYALCFKRQDYFNVLNSPVVGGVDFLWQGSRCKQDIIRQAQQDDSDEFFAE